MKTLEELQAIRDRMRNQISTRQGGEETRVVVGMATCGIAAGARPVLNAFVDEVAKRGLSGIMVTQTGCIGMCKLEPIVEIYGTDGVKTTYVYMTPEKATRVVAEHLVNGTPIKEFMAKE